MKILIVTDPINCSTGSAKQGLGIGKSLLKNHEVSSVEPKNFYGVSEHVKPDVVLCIGEIWSIPEMKGDYKKIAYIPVDSEFVPPFYPRPDGSRSIDTYMTLMMLDQIITPTQWGADAIRRSFGIKNVKVIPHGFESDIWKQQPDRKKYFPILENGDFLVGFIGRNQPRKRLDAILQAISLFIKLHEEDRKIYCYLHSPVNDSLGYDLSYLARLYDVNDRCIINNNIIPGGGLEEEEFAKLVSCFDVHLCLSGGEGWHLPSLECSGANIPTVMTNYSAPAEWGEDKFLFVDPVARTVDSATGHIRAVPDVHQAAEQLNRVYQDEGFGDLAEFAADYDWLNVGIEWRKLFESLEVTNASEEQRDREPVQRD